MHQFQNTSEIAVIMPLQSHPNQYDFSLNPTVWSQGSAFEMNADGRVISAHYPSGAIVKILDSCMIVRSEDYSLWFADSKKHWHPID